MGSLIFTVACIALDYTISDGSEPSAQTHHVVHGLEVEIGGHLHVGAAEGQDAQAEDRKSVV